MKEEMDTIIGKKMVKYLQSLVVTCAAIAAIFSASPLLAEKNGCQSSACPCQMGTCAKDCPCRQQNYYYNYGYSYPYNYGYYYYPPRNQGYPRYWGGYRR